MYKALADTLALMNNVGTLSSGRLLLLQPLIDFVQQKVSNGQAVPINFICSHNARRSHLAQVWAQTAAAYFAVPGVYCYSGGTEVTALFPGVAQTLTDQGFAISIIAGGNNPVYAIKYAGNAVPIIGFSKKYDHPFHPTSGFAAVMTCTQADEGCPFIAGAEKRVPLPFDDPKIADGTPQQAAIYAERSLQIAAEMYYVFSMIRK